jgi:hypothetical protein
MGTQAGECDLMLLKGGSIEDMANKLIKMGLDKNNQGLEAMKGRVLRHISTIRAELNQLYNNHGHNLSSVLKENSNGVWKFTIEGYAESSVNSESSKKHIKNTDSSGEIPTREDVGKILHPLGGEADEDVFKAATVATFTKEGRTLNPNWWEITKKNLIEWSKKG